MIEMSYKDAVLPLFRKIIDWNYIIHDQPGVTQLPDTQSSGYFVVSATNIVETY